MAKLKITLTKSTNKALEKQVRTIEALGLRKIGQSVEKEDVATVRGMIRVVAHMVKVEEI